MQASRTDLKGTGGFCIQKKRKDCGSEKSMQSSACEWPCQQVLLIHLPISNVCLREPNLLGTFLNAACKKMRMYLTSLSLPGQHLHNNWFETDPQGLIRAAVDSEHHPFLLRITLLATLLLGCAICFSAVIICFPQWVKTFDKTFQNYFRRDFASLVVQRCCLPQEFPASQAFARVVHMFEIQDRETQPLREPLKALF